MYKISVPASSANLGPGFDTFGLALNLYNHFYISESDGIIFENSQISSWKDNLVYTSAMEVFKKYDINKKGLHIKFDTNIPLSSGLGSSATCITAGLLGANLLLGKPYTVNELFQLAVSIEGHSDNISAAFFGGFTVSKFIGSEAIYSKVTVSKELDFYVLIPELKLSTGKSRAYLPKQVPLSDASENISSAALMILALQNGDTELLGKVSVDKLHEPYRQDLVPEYSIIKQYALEHGAVNLFLSGAGPSLLCIVDKNIKEYFESKIDPFLNSLSNNWRLHPVNIDHFGAKWIRL